eukprot:93307-Chlamydomonas_euryale.AAC.7
MSFRGVCSAARYQNPTYPIAHSNLPTSVSPYIIGMRDVVQSAHCSSFGCRAVRLRRQHGR